MFSSVSNRAAASVLASSVFPTPVGPEEDERPDGTLRVLDARAGANDGVGHQLDRLVLADDAFVEHLVEAEQLVALPFLKSRDRDAGPARHDVGDLVGGHDLAQQPPAALLAREPGLGRLQSPLDIRQLAVPQGRRSVEVVLALGPLALQPDLFQLLT